MKSNENYIQRLQFLVKELGTNVLMTDGKVITCRLYHVNGSFQEHSH